MPEIGEKISHYTIISAIGTGGMGKVFLAEDAKLGRRTALKFLAPELVDDREHHQRFIREARASSGLNHPNICTIYEINDDSDQPFIAMEYVEGETVAQMVRRRRRNVRQTLDIALQVAYALTEAHRKGIVHRDIKPANIIVNSRGVVKILDFGLAKRVTPEDAAVPQFQTNAGVVLGTASYMPPEQARGLEVDNRADIWSLGVCLYEMLTGRLPFAGETVADTFAAILKGEPGPPSQLVTGIPEELDHLVMQCIERPREKRFQTVEELIAELEAVRDRMSGYQNDQLDRLDDPTEVFHTAPTEHNEAPAATDDVRAAETTAPNNLTETFERIIGREAEIAALSRLIRDPGVRLVTATGIGGTGKTTLSRAVARRSLPHFKDGVFFVEMADVTRPEVVATTIAQPLGIREEGGRPMLDILKDHLSRMEMLLVLDNFEQIIEAAPLVAELLAAAPRLKMVVTSRELLNITAEVEFPVPPLDLPALDSGATFDELMANEAVMLFAERARAALPAFRLTADNMTDVAAICSRLDGLPLAIELAAARVKVMSPAAVLTKLENRLNLLTGGARDLPERQKTMRGAVMWSYDLLSDDEKKVFRQLAVFSGGCGMDSAEHVCGESVDAFGLIDIISSLIDKSLISQKEGRDGEYRFRMLEVVRDFALEMLSAEGELDVVRRRHAEFFVALGETAEPLIQGASSEAWLAKLEEEHDNLRSGMEWCLANAPDLAVRLAVAVRNYWLIHSHLSEGFGWLKAAAETGFQPPPPLRYKLLNGLGLAARFRGDFETARRAYEKGLAAGMEAGDKQGTALSNRGLGLVAMQQGDLAAARIYFDTGLAISRELNDKYGIAMSLSFLGDLARTEGRYEDARPIFKESVHLFRELENKTAVSDALNNLGATKYCLGETAEAAANFSEALASARELSNRITISCSLDGLAAVAAENGELEKAVRIAGAAERLREVIGYEIEPAEAKLRDQYVTKLKERISESDFRRLAAEGANWPLETAINEALESGGKASSPTSAKSSQSAEPATISSGE